MMKSLLAVAFLLHAVPAWGGDVGQIPPDISPAVREWFQAATSKNGICCNIADGHRTDYDTRDNAYWVTINGREWRVPEDALVKGKNPLDEAIVWYIIIDAATQPYHKDMSPGDVLIRCFIPGPGA
jgi:hypothetical protein